uniref:Uncharacterized protein n=1 Tax=Oryza sativa subsp. japonica TaxID=39947 RepID=Q5Z5D1_ORYSJ|nr:hypothetical protein [Oryza sativa Japonica Group]BAD62092.1 hypothetical protein [Oryza sativa Japonica Group]
MALEEDEDKIAEMVAAGQRQWAHKLVEAFKHLRSVLAIDGTFLTGKFRGVLLTKIGTLSDQP